MGQRIKYILKLGAGLAISAVFLYLAFRKVDFQKLGEAIGNANSALLIPAVLVLFMSHWLRATRHGYLLGPVKRIGRGPLFSALMIAYMANTLLPAHLGELLRAYVIGKKEGIAGSSALATIVVERVIDVLSLLVIMGLVLMIYPFPAAFKFSAYVTFAFAIGMVGLLVLLKRRPRLSLSFIEVVTRPFPRKIRKRLSDLLKSFQRGIVGLEDRRSYAMVFVLSLLIWLGYAGVFAIGFHAFDFIVLYNLPIGASLVVLVVTMFSILVPSSPGYVGTYHWLCMVALSLFGVPESPALGFAIVIHAISMILVALVGLTFAIREGISVLTIGRQGALSEVAIADQLST